MHDFWIPERFKNIKNVLKHLKKFKFKSTLMVLKLDLDSVQLLLVINIF